MNFTPTWPVLLQNPIREVSLFVLRLWLGQEFLFAAYHKLSGGLTPPGWFSQLDFPFPHGLLGPQVNWVLAGVGELALGLALVLGLYTRLAALGLLYITFIATYTVHFDLGWAGWRLIETDEGNGFKVPLMIAIMLLILVGHGGGRWSIGQLAHDTTTT
jgi:putative oxidoreductase